MTNDCDHDRNETTDHRAETGTDISDAALSTDAILEVLANHRRREVLRFLIDASNHTATVDELATRIAAREIERTGECPGRDDIELALYHIHLPKLTEPGIVEYDPRSQELRYWRHERLEDVQSDGSG